MSVLRPVSPVLLFLLVVASLALGWILLPFYGTLMWAAIIALLFAPVQRRMLAWLGGRRTPAALLTLLIVLMLVVVPFAFLTAALAGEATGVYDRVQSGEWNPGQYLRRLFDALPDWVMALLGRFGLAGFDALQLRLATLLTQAIQFIATHALGIGQNTLEFVTSLFVTMYLAFFMIRDGDRIALAVQRSIPLPPEDRQALIAMFSLVIRATVKGNLLVAAVQGALGGLAFWFLGVNAALLWAVLMAFLSLLPAVGAALVWLPVAIYLLAADALWQGLALIAWGVLVIGLIDNLLRPILVGKDTKVPDYVVMITTLGGMAVFGINGFVLGPVIAAMFIAVWHISVARRAPHSQPVRPEP